MTSLLYAVQAADQHHFPRHPECPERVHSIVQTLSALDLELKDGKVTRLTDWSPATEDALTAVHTRAHIAAVREAAAGVSAPTAIRDPEDPDGPTYATPTSYTDALRAVGAAMALADAVMAASAAGGPMPAAASFCRPPGHHATPGDQMGFCLFNSVAVVARHLQQRHGLQKVLILDFDVHHGNGTQDIFESDPSVLFIDIHQQDVWPGTGRLDEAGAGEGRGATINIPLPWYSGHLAVQRAWQAVVAPAAQAFRPDFILVSAGYDAHVRDPLEHLQLQSASYHWLAAQLRTLAAQLCGGRLLLVLEGGYCLEALAESAAESVRALLGHPPATALLPPEALPDPEPLQAVEAVLAEVQRLHGLGE